MSIQRITSDNTEFFSIETNPSRSYSSRPRRDGSGAKIYFTGTFGNPEAVLDNTGSVNVFAIRSPFEKETYPLGPTNRTAFEDHGFEQFRQNILNLSASLTDIESPIESYLLAVTNTSESLRKQKKQEIIRFVPTFNFTSNTIRKNLVVDHLLPYYRTSYPLSAQFAYTNYHSLHFFSSASTSDTSFPTPNDSVLVYPNPSGSQVGTGQYDSNYGFKSGEAFSFDFWINPKYSEVPYKAGTVLHLSSAYAISVVSGSQKDENGKPDRFRIMLQLGSGSLGKGPSRLPLSENLLSGVFLSSDDAGVSLKRNEWNHVALCYGGSDYNHGSGSFIINGQRAGTFFVADPGFALYDSGKTLEPFALCVGNFFEGDNELNLFFNPDSSLRDGVLQLTDDTDEPTGFSFNHPLNAEIHDLKIYNKYLTSEDISSLNKKAPASLDGLKLYIPPFFTTESPYRAFVGSNGGEFVTPFEERDGSTETPYAADMAFGVGGLYPNLENYVRDFATGNYPRLYALTGSTLSPGNSVLASANEFLYTSSSCAGNNKKRLYSVLPCDHGNWIPNFGFLEEMSGAFNGRYSNDLGNPSLGLVSLRNLVSSALTIQSENSDITNDVFGTSPEDFNRGFTGALTLLHRLRDNSSNQVVVFDISNLFYGKQIKPGSLVLTDPILSGSDNKFGMVLKDDGMGNLYRADSLDKDHATWASVGNVFYNEGLVLIKHPNLSFFGEEGFDISFRGVQNIHVYTISAYARPQQLVSSSNPTFDEALEANSDLKNEQDQRFVYISSILIHDENMNVIMKSNLAQPVLKRSGDKIVFKTRIDF
jgi:hypothetical protein